MNGLGVNDMTDNELKILSEVLRISSDKLSNNGCNDVPPHLWDDWTFDEVDALVKEFEDYNSGGSDYEKGYHIAIYSDSTMLWFFYKKINNLSLKEMRVLSSLMLHAIPNIKGDFDVSYLIKDLNIGTDITDALKYFADKVNSREERINAII